MQIKTIRNNIELKLNQWLFTITDEDLRTKVKNNLLVSGGSIVSMLLDEPVNDYDIYIKDMDVLRDLAEYYTKPYCPNIVVFDGRRKDEYLSTINQTHNIYTIAINNLKSEQIKLYFNDKKGGMAIPENTKEELKLNYVPLFFSPNAISLSGNIQIITRFHGDNETIHKTFDFIHATNYFTFSKGIVTNKKALESILTKQLKYQGSFYPLTSIIRMKKFIKRGWNINAGEILKIMFQISELNLKDFDVLEEQLIGIDVAYFNTLIEILRNITDKSILTSHYINTLIERVFDGSGEEIGI